ncbi:hypothetical protein [Pyruvatibacter sp.]|uniref:hypothetical protein n=1 Tax=Pyruvatibacter sp. TaxID=1981328 RepID=UPI0032ECF26D
MIWIARIAVGLAGLFSLAMGLQTFFTPEAAAVALGLGSSLPDLGMNTFRADVGAFFLAAATFCIIGLFAGRPGAIYGAALLYGLALIGRILGVVMAGAPAGVETPIVVEAILVLLLVFGARTLGKR